MHLSTQHESYLPNLGPDSGVLLKFYEPRLIEMPEETLMRHVLDDLINILSGGMGNMIQDGRHDSLYQEAVRDLMSDQVEPFTPAFCFNHFGIDIAAARKALLTMKNLRPVQKRIRRPRLYIPKTQCKRGHPITGENRYNYKKGGYGCRMCRILSTARYHERVAG